MTWVNVGNSSILLYISSSESSWSKLLNPGYGIVLGKRSIFYEISFSKVPGNLEEVFEENQNPMCASLLGFTMGVDNPNSWLNALNVNRPAESPRGRQESTLPRNSNQRSSIQDRLEKLGVPLKKKPMIRVAPVKDAGLEHDLLGTKVKALEEWVTNLRLLNGNVILPELWKVVSVWETPRIGDRFKILRLLFKSTEGIDTMYDLLHGSKVDLVAGFPEELEGIRDKIYITRPNPQWASAGRWD